MSSQPPTSAGLRRSTATVGSRLGRVLLAPIRGWLAHRQRRRAAEVARHHLRDQLDAELAALHEDVWRDWPEMVARTRERVREESCDG